MDSRVDTYNHKQMVCNIMNSVAQMLLKRALEHDNSKLASPELELFDEFTLKLKSSTYGSAEYNEFLKQLKPALDHHYATYRHHPEHFVNGCKDMNIVDVVEMLVDWKAATLRHDNGNLLKSLEHNITRFNLKSVTLYDILKNSVELFETFNK